jgi:hypothetical protein
VWQDQHVLPWRWELPVPPGEARLGQRLGVYLESRAPMGLWRMEKCGEGTHIVHLRVEALSPGACEEAGRGCGLRFWGFHCKEPEFTVIMTPAC